MKIDLTMTIPQFSPGKVFTARWDTKEGDGTEFSLVHDRKETLKMLKEHDGTSEVSDLIKIGKFRRYGVAIERWTEITSVKAIYDNVSGDPLGILVVFSLGNLQRRLLIDLRPTLTSLLQHGASVRLCSQTKVNSESEDEV